MNILVANLKNELQKLSVRKKYIVFLIIEVLICIISVLSKLLINVISRGQISLKAQSMPLSMLQFFIEVLIPLVIFMAATDLFCTEFQDNTIKAILSRPISRFKVFTSKVFAVTILAIINLLCIFVTTSILEAISTGTIVDFGNSLSAYILDIIPMFVLVLMAAFINQLGKSSTLSMFMCIVVYVVLKVGSILIPELSGLLFTGYLQWHNIWLGNTLPFGAILSKMSLLLGYGLIFFSGGFYLFAKRDL